MRNIKSILITLVIVALLLSVIIVLLHNQEVNYNATNNEKIKIGLSLPLTGEVASWGQNALAGFTLALKENPELAQDIELVTEDDKCDTSSVNVLQKLINLDGVRAIFGLVCSGAASAALPIAKEHNIPTIIIASAPDLTSIGDNIFRIYPSDNFEGKEAAQFILNDLGKRKIALVYVQNDWGVGIQKIFKDEFYRLGGEIVYQSNVLESDIDLKTVAVKIDASKAEALYFPVYPSTGLAFFKQMKEAGLNIPVIGGSAFDGQEVYTNELAEGVYYIISSIQVSDEFKAKIQSLEGLGNLPISLAATLGYDSANILLHALADNRNDLKQALSKSSYAGVSNPLIEFDENGDLKNSSFEARIIQNKQSVKYKDL